MTEVHRTYPCHLDLRLHGCWLKLLKREQLASPEGIPRKVGNPWKGSVPTWTRPASPAASADPDHQRSNECLNEQLHEPVHGSNQNQNRTRVPNEVGSLGGCHCGQVLKVPLKWACHAGFVAVSEFFLIMNKFMIKKPLNARNTQWGIAFWLFECFFRHKNKQKKGFCRLKN